MAAAPTPTTLEVEHLTCYRYAEPVDLAQHLGYLRPLDSPEQQVALFEMRVEPEPMNHHSQRDWLGNRRTCFTVTVPHRELRVHAFSRVQATPADPLDPGASLPWEQVRERLRYEAGAPFEPASEFVFASPYVPAVPALHAYARDSLTAGRPIAEVAIELMQRIHDDFVYCSASTEIDTPLADVLATRRGVCQDFAHLMIGALRCTGLAARYVSGYLLTSAPASGATSAPMVGADASHAWVAVWCPMTDGGAARWLELDPTNRLLPSTSHVRLAVGRDYGDVSPLRGVIRGGGEHELEVQVSTRRVV